MIRGILIFAIIGYLLFRFGRFLFRFLHLMSGEQGNQPAGHTFDGKKRPVDGNVNVDKVPNKPHARKKYKGGEYIDYEEL
ncbi:MAG: hypothetical protein MI921_21500 [Cytophagales bacterium]|nr:hypothetical protein [Cytophagales bacterium]